MVRAVIFDIDGTLIDSVDAHAEAWLTAFREFGVDIPYREVRRQIGKGADQLLPALLEKSQLDQIGKGVEARQGDIFRQQFLDEIRPFSSVRALFERLKSDGIERVLASSGKPAEVKRYQEIAGVSDLVVSSATSDDAHHSKPSPDIIRVALDRIPTVRSSDCLFVGDTPYDAEAAVGAKVRPVGVLSGGFEEQALRAAGCIAIYRDIADILDHYEALISLAH